MTQTNSGNRAANPAEKATETLASSFEEFQGAMTRFIFPPEGYARADVIGLTTNLQVASLRLWLAAVQAPVQMIAGVDLPQAALEQPRAMPKDVFIAATPAPIVSEPVVAPAVAQPSISIASESKAPASTPKLLVSTSVVNASNAQVVPFRREEPAASAFVSAPSQAIPEPVAPKPVKAKSGKLAANAP